MARKKFLSKVTSLFLALLVLVIFVSNFSAHLSASNTIGPVNARTGTDSDEYGQTAWSNPGNITVADSPFATINLAHGKFSHYLVGTNYGFNIPEESTINGITVNIRRTGGQNGAYGIEDRYLYLVKNGQIYSDNKAETFTNWPASMITQSYGSENDLWGLDLTAADINSVNFGVALCVINNGQTGSFDGSVDFLQISVTYTRELTATTTSVTSTENPSNCSQPVSFTALITPDEASGTVQFKIDDVDFGGPAPLTNGSATSLSISSLSAGNHVVAAVYSGDASFNTSTGILTGGQTVNKAVATIALSNLIRTYDSTPNAVTVSTDPTGLNVIITYDGVSTIPINAGSYVVIATVDDANYSGEATGTLVISKAYQSITFGTLANKTYGDAPFTLGGSASSGLPLSYSIVSGPASLNGNTVTLTGAGSVTIKASQGGNNDFNPASDVTRSFTVAKANQIIILGTFSNKTYGDISFTLSGSASSGLPLSCSIVSGPAIVSGNTVTLTGAGSVTLKASQEGNSNYNAAPDVTRSFTVAKAQPVFSNLTGPSINPGTPNTSLGGTLKAGSLLPSGAVSITLNGVQQSVTIDSSGNFSSSFVTGALTTANSPYTITYSYAGDLNYKAAQDSSRTLKVTVGAATVILSNLDQVYDGYPKSVTSATDPPGLNVTFTYNGLVTAPSDAGSYAVVGAVSDGGYSGEASGTLVIAKVQPFFSNLAAPSIVAGTTPTSLGGALKAGSLVPSGAVSITLNGVQQSATIDSGGNFTSSFVTGSLTASGSPYPIAYAFAGDTNFQSTTDSSQALTVTGTVSPGGNGGGAAGGGGGAPMNVSPVVTSGFKPGNLEVDSSGKVKNDAELKSSDEKVSLSIRQNTEMRDSQNKILTRLNATRVESPPANSLQKEIAMAYDFGPEGAKFQPPITLTLIYDPTILSGGITGQSLGIAWWDGTSWIDQACELNIAANSISTRVSHFSLYALVVNKPNPTTTTPLTPNIAKSPTPLAPVDELPEAPDIEAPPAVTPPSETGSNPVPINPTSAAAPGGSESAPAQNSDRPWLMLLLVYIGSFILATTATIMVVTKLRQKKSP